MLRAVGAAVLAALILATPVAAQEAGATRAEMVRQVAEKWLAEFLRDHWLKEEGRVLHKACTERELEELKVTDKDLADLLLPDGPPDRDHFIATYPGWAFLGFKCQEEAGSPVTTL